MKILNSFEFKKIKKLYKDYDQFFITGLKKRGKSGVRTLFEMVYHSYKDKLRDTYKDIDELRANGYEHLEKPDTLVYNDSWTQLEPDFKHKSLVFNNEVESYKFGLPDGTDKFQYFEKNALISLDEILKDFDSHAKNTLEETEKAFTTSGHNYLKLILATQRDGDAALRIKGLSDLFIYVYKKPVTLWFPVLRFKGGRLKIEKQVFMTTFKAVIYNQFEDLQKKRRPLGFGSRIFVNIFRAIFGGGDITDRVCEYKNFRYWGNIFAHYDSHFYRPAWLKGLENNGFLHKKPLVVKGYKPLNVEEFNNRYRLIKPKAYRKKKSKN